MNEFEMRDHIVIATSSIWPETIDVWCGKCSTDELDVIIYHGEQFTLTSLMKEVEKHARKKHYK